MKSDFALLGATLALIAASPTIAGEAPGVYSKTEKAKAAQEKPEAAKPAKPAAKAETKKYEKTQQDKSTVVDREDPCRRDPDLSGCAKETNRSK